MMKVRMIGMLALLAPGLLAACSGRQLKADELAAPKVAIQSAKQAGATEVPQANYHLKLAQAQMDKADKLAAEGRPYAAQRMLERAELDARVALLSTKTTKLERELKGSPGMMPRQRKESK